MATAVSRYFDTREGDDDYGSEAETATLVGSVYKSRVGGMRYVNSATSVENEIFRSEGFQTDSDAETSENEECGRITPKASSITTKIGKIDLSPEALQKRKEVYDKWLNSVNKRDKERKRLERERHEAKIAELRALETERCRKSEEKIRAWMRKKELEAKRKMAQITDMKNAAIAASKPKEFKKALIFDEWLVKKNEEIIASKKAQEEKKKNVKSIRDDRDSLSAASYNKWMRESSRMPKPVPVGKGLLSLRGSSTKIHINPDPWVFD